MLSVLLRFTVSDYPFGIYNFFFFLPWQLKWINMTMTFFMGIQQYIVDIFVTNKTKSCLPGFVNFISTCLQQLSVLEYLMFVCKFNMTKLPFVVCQYFVYRLITERIPMTWTWMLSGFSSGTYNGRKVQFSLTQIIYAYIKICIYNVVLFLSSRAHELREVGLLHLFILKYHSDQNVNQQALKWKAKQYHTDSI
jgi:hypothetical protein